MGGLCCFRCSPNRRGTRLILPAWMCRKERPTWKQTQAILAFKATPQVCSTGRRASGPGLGGTPTSRSAGAMSDNSLFIIGTFHFPGSPAPPHGPMPLPIVRQALFPKRGIKNPAPRLRHVLNYRTSTATETSAREINYGLLYSSKSSILQSST